MPWETKEKAIFVCAKRFKQMDWVFSKKQLAEKKNTKISAEDRKQDLFKKYLQKQTKKEKNGQTNTIGNPKSEHWTV